MPVFAEAIGVAAAGFIAGLILAYLVELRRRASSEWRW